MAGRPKGLKQDAETMRQIKTGAIAAMEAAYKTTVIAPSDRDERRRARRRVQQDEVFMELLEEPHYRFQASGSTLSAPELLLVRECRLGAWPPWGDLV